MLLGSKKNQKNEQNWCLILNPIFSELDKRKVARKISEAFSLSGEESNDLVNNTPIILLDNLDKDIASQVKEYFRPTGAEMLMTNEIYVKRKCYRTVWPETPALSFLQSDRLEEAVELPKEMPPASENSQPLRPDEALHEIRSLQEQVESIRRNQEDEPQTQTDSEERSRMVQELDRMKRERDAWREKFESQRRTLDKLSWDIATRDGHAGNSNETVSRLEKDMVQQRELAKRNAEKYEILHEEYRQAKVLFEERLQAAAREADEWKNRAEALSSEMKNAKEDRYFLSSRLKEQEERMSQWEDQKQALEDELQSLRQYKEEEESRHSENEGRLQEWEQTRESLMRMLREEQSKFQKLEAEFQGLKARYDERAMMAVKELEELRLSLRTKEEKVQSVERNQLRLIQDLEARTAEGKQWESQARDMERKARELQLSHENMEKMFRVNLTHLENRERELETARRQMKDLQTQLEQYDSVQKRAQVASLLQAKESRLHELVKQQDMIEQEIRSREELIRKILAEQEAVEKEILEGKQSQRHYMEQIKKEKMPRIKINKDLPASSKPSGTDKDLLSPLDD